MTVYSAEVQQNTGKIQDTSRPTVKVNNSSVLFQSIEFIHNSVSYTNHSKIETINYENPKIILMHAKDTL